MKAFLMHRDRDFNVEAPLPPNSEALIQDLELNVLFDVMAQGDKYLRETASKAVLQDLSNEDEVRYRQDILRDVLANPILIRHMYDLTIEAHEKEKKRIIGCTPDHRVRYWGNLLISCRVMSRCSSNYEG